ncbi:MAG TPA: fasciclin domain-containing protein [Flammeovirgaceae bacterium]|nr:fasciclin domain-containing protein [Flammeovirgaceae bacterium]
MKSLLYTLTIACTLGLLAACSSGGGGSESAESTVDLTKNTPKGQASVVDNESKANILQVAMSSPDHTTLVKAVEAASIEHVLVNAGPLTVFAPTNAAFDKLPAGTLDDLLKPENKGKLAEILTRHAAPGSYDIEDLKKEAAKGRKLYMATGDYLDVTTEGDDVFVNGIKVEASIYTSNGVINVINDVILPK